MNAEGFYDRINAALDELLPADLDRDLTVDDVVLIRGAFARIFSDALGDAHETALQELLAAAREFVEQSPVKPVPLLVSPPLVVTLPWPPKGAEG